LMSPPSAGQFKIASACGGFLDFTFCTLIFDFDQKEYP
jgi:hypothetical protein